ncbi:type II toxin-antitoxin system Phd/YefM family antitoxin [Pararhizobium sp.]|uniref:type II toxin-antitoxin system Phd/YefM family antitoxin n=1 Tax=Pararhizobium sp. TaxID=1977563 RepID=UPI003D1420B9
MSTTLSSREFNQDTGRAKKAAADGPVFITDRGRPAHVLLSIEEYRKLTASKPVEMPKRKSIAELLSMPSDDDIDFELPDRSADWEFKVPDFS